MVVGATGLVGSSLLRQLLGDESCQSITVLARRPLDWNGAPAEAHHKLKVIIADFDDMQAALDDVEADLVFCALGTTIKAAGSRQAFRKVDYEYPLALAQWAVEQEVRHFLVITAMGSDQSSPFFYSRVKGDLEDALMRMPFESVRFFQPSLLLGQRPSMRLGESVGAGMMKAFQWLMVGPLRRYRPIQGEAVAKAMRFSARQAMSSSTRPTKVSQPAVYTYSSEQLVEMARQIR